MAKVDNKLNYWLGPPEIRPLLISYARYNNRDEIYGDYNAKTLLNNRIQRIYIIMSKAISLRPEQQAQISVHWPGTPN
jgi:hypothetical protein